MSYSLQDPRTVAYYAAMIEAEQAERDFSEAYRLMEAAGGVRALYSAADYAMWSAGGYADSAARLVRDMPVLEVTA